MKQVGGFLVVILGLVLVIILGLSSCQDKATDAASAQAALAYAQGQARATIIEAQGQARLDSAQATNMMVAAMTPLIVLAVVVLAILTGLIIMAWVMVAFVRGGGGGNPQVVYMLAPPEYLAALPPGLSRRQGYKLLTDEQVKR